MRRRFVVRVIEPWQTCFSAMQHHISRSQVIHLCIMAPLQRGLSRAYFTYDRDCDGRLRPSPFREGIGYLRPRRFAHCIDFITDQGRSGFPLRPCAACQKSLAEFRVRRREINIIRFLPRHVRGRKHFTRSERRIVRYQRTTEAQNEAVLSRKSGQATFSTVSAPLQRWLSLAYFTYDRDCDGRLRPSPFREGIGYLRPRRFAHCIDFITDQGRSGFPLRPCALLVVVIYGWRPM